LAAEQISTFRWDPTDPDKIEWLAGYFDDLKRFFDDAANKKHGMLLFLA
jgi:hypothetical protein